MRSASRSDRQALLVAIGCLVLAPVFAFVIGPAVSGLPPLVVGLTILIGQVALSRRGDQQHR